MKIELKNIKIADLVDKYKDDGENGVFGYHGKLEIRPIYQREFVYKEDKRNKVIDTIFKGFPLNIMYWVDRGNDEYEVLDGQQRTISICEYVKNNFSIVDKNNNIKYFENLSEDEKNNFKNYELSIYFCSGTDVEKLEWFETINIAGEKLTNQELLNALYTGVWLTDAKKHFSKTNCVAYQKANKLLNGNVVRQEYLETVLEWISHRDYGGKINIKEYMAKHQKDNDSNELWQYFESVVDWVNRIFKVYRKDMKGINWGILYNLYKDKNFNTNDVEKEISRLINDDEVTYKKGIYQYILSGDDKYLNIRAFTEDDKIIAFNKQMVGKTGKANCPKCNDVKKLYEINEMEADHIVPWSKGGKTILTNCQMLCKYHNGVKSNK